MSDMVTHGTIGHHPDAPCPICTEELRATVTRLEGENAEMRKGKDFLQDSMMRVANAVEVSCPEQLMAEAQSNEETYTDILVRLAGKVVLERDTMNGLLKARSADIARLTAEVKRLEGERDALAGKMSTVLTTEEIDRLIDLGRGVPEDFSNRVLATIVSLRAELDRASETKWNPYPDTKPNEGELVLVLLGEEIGPPRQRMSRFERGEFYRFVEPTPNDRIMSVYYAGVKAWSRFNSPSPAPASPVPSERKANVCGDIERNYLNLPSPLPAESGNEASEKFVAKFKSEIDRLFPAGIPATFASTNPLPAERGVCVYEQIGRTDENGNPEVIWRGQCNIEEDVIVAGSLCMCCLRTIQLAEEK